MQATTTDVHIRDGTTALFDGTLTGLGQAQVFDFTLNTSTSETLDFLVGNGGNGDAHDLTGLTLTIQNAAVLTIEKQGNNVVLRWPTAAPNNWTPTQEIPTIEGAFWKVVRPGVPGGEFFRLFFSQPQET